ncbi:MAG: flagellar hook-length control protein FliK [Firmicutes bacterium]|nr:flagellar hook-length control protein FliK [Bacillota bacterium]
MNVTWALAPELTCLATAVPKSGHRGDSAGGFAALLALLLQQAFPAGTQLLSLQGEAALEKDGASPPAGEPLQDRKEDVLGACLMEQSLLAMLAACSMPGVAGAGQQESGFDALAAQKLLLAAALAGQAGKAQSGGIAATGLATEKSGGILTAPPAAGPSGNVQPPESAMLPTGTVSPEIAALPESTFMPETAVPSVLDAAPAETAEPAVKTVPTVTAEAFAATEAIAPAAQFADSLAAAAKGEQAEPPPAAKAELKRQPVLTIRSEAAKEAAVEEAAGKDTVIAPDGRQEALPEKAAASETGRTIRPNMAESLLAANRKAVQQAGTTQAVHAARADSGSPPAAAPEAPGESDRAGLYADILEQILEKIEFSVRKDGEQKLYVRLRPETLGEVEIRLKLESGRLTAKIVTDSYQVKELLDASLPQISRRLEAQQVTLAGFSVTVGQEQNPGRQAESWQTGHHWRQPVQEKQAAGDAMETIEQAGRVNLLA